MPAIPDSRQLSELDPISDVEWSYVIEQLELSPCQSHIVHLLVQGKRDKQIASTLGRSVATVRTHLRAVFTRHRISDRTELAVRVFSLLRRRDHDLHRN